MIRVAKRKREKIKSEEWYWKTIHSHSKTP